MISLFANGSDDTVAGIFVLGVLFSLIIAQYILILIKQKQILTLKESYEKEIAILKQRKRQAIVVIRNRQKDRHKDT